MATQKRKAPVNYFGCAFDMSASDKRQEGWKQQRATRGFDDTELWNLDHTIAQFIAPRLREFSKSQLSHPGNLTPEAWKKILYDMAEGFDLMKDGEIYYSVGNTPERRKMDRAWRLFSKWHRHLWN